MLTVKRKREKKMDDCMSVENRHKKTGSFTWKWLETRKRLKVIDFRNQQDIDNPKRELPLCLIESDILTRLPAKSVGRCRCVCKQWKSFLSTPTFVRKHLNHVTVNDYKLLLVDSEPRATIRTLDNSASTIRYPAHRVRRVVASLDGLVCLAIMENIVTYNLVFWNPLTGAYKKLSSRPCCGSFDEIPPLIYDVISFYIDDSCNDYKLLDLVVMGRFRAFIYSHRLDSWREIVSPVLSDHKLSSCSQASLWGDCLYFTVTYETNNDWGVICFDVKTESFRKIHFPHVPCYIRDNCVGSLVVLNGFLHLCVSYTDYLWKQGGLFIINADGDGFVKVSTFSFQLTFDDIKSLYPYTATTSTADNWLVFFNKETDCFKKVNVEDFTKQYWYICSPSCWMHSTHQIIYVETLVSPKP